MHVVAGPPSVFSARLASLLAHGPGLDVPMLINADAEPDAAAIMRRSRQFADDAGSGDSVVLTVLRAAPPGLDQFDRHTASAVLWAFTRQAALAWAPRRIRVNALYLEWGFDEVAGMDDVVRSIRAVAGFACMTGQRIRLGTAPS